MEIIGKILEWPIIVQGALGSGLFWLVLFAGQKITNKISEKWNSDKKTANYFAKSFSATKHEAVRHLAFQSSMYGVLHYFTKSILIVVLSFIFGEFIPLFQTLGLIISLYFLFRTLSYVPHFDSFPSKEELRKELGWKDDK